MAIPVDLAVVVCIAASLTVPPIDITVVVGDGLGSSGDSIVLINGIICTLLCYYYTSYIDITIYPHPIMAK